MLTVKFSQIYKTVENSRNMDATLTRVRPSDVPSSNTQPVFIHEYRTKPGTFYCILSSKLINLEVKLKIILTYKYSYT